MPEAREDGFIMPSFFATRTIVGVGQSAVYGVGKRGGHADAGSRRLSRLKRNKRVRKFPAGVGRHFGAPARLAL
jgi:hypothetical protein